MCVPITQRIYVTSNLFYSKPTYKCYKVLQAGIKLTRKKKQKPNMLISKKKKIVILNYTTA